MAPTTETRAARRSGRVVALLAGAAIALASCGGSTTPDADTGPGAVTGSPTSDAVTPSPEPRIAIPPVDGPYDWTIDATDFVEGVDNPYFPLEPGKRLVYRGQSDGEREVVTIEVLDRTKEILGITCVVVKDTVEVAGELKELTFDWYAQDVDGNVWYLGEDTAEYEDGKVVTHEGAWEAGVDGALAGVIMPADPTVGLAYTQEHYAGEAEDKGKVVAVGERVTVPFGSFDDVVVTEDWTPLERKVLETKSYAPGIGVVFEEIVKGGDGVLRLVDVSGS